MMKIKKCSSKKSKKTYINEEISVLTDWKTQQSKSVSSSQAGNSFGAIAIKNSKFSADTEKPFVKFTWKGQHSRKQS